MILPNWMAKAKSWIVRDASIKCLSVKSKRLFTRLCVEQLDDRIVPTIGFGVAADSYNIVHDHVLNAPASGSNGIYGLLYNDTGIDAVSAVNGNAASVGQSISLPSGAGLIVYADGGIVYTPVLNSSYLDTFSYTGTDGAESGTATVTIEVSNTLPTAADDFYETGDDAALTVSAANGVLANDSDPDDGEVLVAELVTGPYHGSVTLNQDGSFEYDPALGFSGQDSFTYNVFDGAGGVAQANMVIQVGARPTVVVTGDFQAVAAAIGNNQLRDKINLLFLRTGSDANALTINYTVTWPNNGFQPSDVFENSADLLNGEGQSGSITIAAGKRDALLELTVKTDFHSGGITNFFVTIEANNAYSVPGANERVYLDPWKPGQYGYPRAILEIYDST